jgi:starch-binding outer membrane protein, SusD/RagB family
MKKFNIIITLLLFTVLSIPTGCTDDFLTEDVRGKLTNEGFPKDVDQLGEAVHGLYNAAASISRQVAIITRNCGTEQLTSLLPPRNKYYQVYCDMYTMHLEQATAGEPRDMPIWGGCYSAIKQANWLIENVDNASVPDPKILDLARGQAHYIRALAYFNLTRYFGELPLITSTDINTKVTELSSVKDVYDLILSDLENAMQMLPEFAWDEANIGPAARTMPKIWAGNKAIPTQGTIRSLRSQVYITMAGWPLNETERYADAAADAKYVIDNKTSFGYDLEPDFKNLWLYEKQFDLKEDIISFFYHSDGLDQILAPQSTRPANEPGEPWNGWNDLMVERPFFFNYPYSYRKEISFTTAWYTHRRSEPKDWKQWHETGYFHPYLAKFRSTKEFPLDSLWADRTVVERSVILLRYANVLANYAEASTRATNAVSADALEAVNQIRRRAHNNAQDSRFPIQVVDIYASNELYDLPSNLTPEQFLDSLLMEKNYEFTGEPEGRWHDLVRLDKVYDVAQMVKAQRANTQSTDNKEDQSQPTSSYLDPLVPNLKDIDITTDRQLLHWYFPPLSEIQNNPDLFN